MNNITYTFFEEFKKLQKLCNDMYASHNGVTNYIDDMNAVPYSSFCLIPNWMSDLKQLKRLRHIRNILAHEEGAFDKDMCTLSDVKWIQAFYDRILNQADPLSVLHQMKKTQPRKESSSKNTTSVAVYFVITLIVVITLILGIAIPYFILS